MYIWEVISWFDECVCFVGCSEGLVCVVRLFIGDIFLSVAVDC